jgi:hypothetical protein
LSLRKKGRSFGELQMYNKTRINIGHQHDRWVKLKEAFRVQIQAEVQTSGPFVFLLFSNKIKKNKKYNTTGTVPKSNRKIDKNRLDIVTIYTPLFDH